MSNIIINPNSLSWSETPAEKTMRQKGYAAKDQGVMEIGFDFSAEMTRKELMNNPALDFMKCLYQLRQAMADQNWDDSKCMVVVGIQIRNGWERDGDGEWIETGSHRQVDKMIRKAMK